MVAAVADGEGAEPYACNSQSRISLTFFGCTAKSLLSVGAQWDTHMASDGISAVGTTAAAFFFGCLGGPAPAARPRFTVGRAEAEGAVDPDEAAEATGAAFGRFVAWLELGAWEALSRSATVRLRPGG